MRNNFKNKIYNTNQEFKDYKQNINKYNNNVMKQYKMV
jgi:uncharacterized short protein YbdD (DUF466 family)